MPKQWFFILCLFVNNYVCANLNQLICDDNNVPAPALTALLDVLNIPHNGSLESIHSAMQKHLLIQGVEDWLMPENPSYDRVALIPLLMQLRLFGDIVPNKMSYDNLILLGGNLWSMRSRIAYIVKLWNEGCRFNKIVIMAGEHLLDKGRYLAPDLFEYSHPGLPLDPAWNRWQKFPKDEGEMITMILEQVVLPQDLRKLEWEMIVSRVDPITGMRPTTLDNALDFFNRHNGPASHLIISNQPFIGYQHAVFMRHVPEHITIETVGPKAFGDYNMSMYLDRLTRWVYEIGEHNRTLHNKAKL